MMILDEQECPCCSGKSFIQCCKEIVAGNKFANTPLELMRSRYTAHVCKDMAHILRTMRGKPLRHFDEEKTQQEWFDQCIWTKLEIIAAPEVGANEKHGIVEFKAYYNLHDEQHVLHERSKFEKDHNQWYYVARQNKGAEIQLSDKIGRNDPCVCGSGQKYKKCCLNEAK